VSNFIPEIDQIAAKAEAAIAANPKPAAPVITSSSSIMAKIQSQAAGARTKTQSPRQQDSTPVGISILPIQKPNKNDFNRVLMSSAYQPLEGLRFLEDKNGTGRSQLYWLDPSANLPEEIWDKAITVSLVFAANHHGRLFLWPLKHGQGDWYDSSKTAIEACIDDWYAVRWAENAYTLHSPSIRPGDPKWERLAPYNTVVEASLSAVAITGPEHVVVRRLLGETIDQTERPSIWGKRFLSA
jgi:hypothetical protein